MKQNRLKLAFAAALVMAGVASAAFLVQPSWAAPAKDKAPAPAFEPKQDDPKANTLTDDEKKAGWRLLFDGKTTDGWQSYRKDKVEGWTVTDGMLLTHGGKGDLRTADKFEWFELELDYNISHAGNSGIIFHCSEEGHAPYETGPEFQLLDNPNNGDGHKTGWLYDIYDSKVDATKPAGQWNHIRLVLSPTKCEHFVNGKKYLEYVIGSEDYNQRVAKSKFGKWPLFNKLKSGYIDLQDHGAAIAFRSIKLRPIAGENASVSEKK